MASPKKAEAAATEGGEVVSKGASQYKQIDGVRYERDLLEFADEAMKSGGTISIAEAKELWKKAMDGNKVTPTERRTLEYILKEKKFTEPSAAYLKGELEKTAASTGVEAAAAEPAAVSEETKVEEASAVKEEVAATKEEEKPKEPEKPKELEEDAPNDKRKKMKDGSVAWNMSDSTLNVLPAYNGKLMSTLSDSGFQHLLASVRANTGMKAGRYMFEAKVFEQNAAPSQQHQHHQQHDAKGWGKHQQQAKRTAVVRVGLSLAATPLIGEEDQVFFDNEGYFVSGKKRVRTNQKFAKGSSLAVLVNLDALSSNADTVSIFVNGIRKCEPQKLPESWKGKALFPTATYRGVTLQVNFGPAPESKLPFTCRMLADAAQADVELAKVAAGGQPEVVLPVCLPDHGMLDWADDFLTKNPSFTEISGRKMLDWAVKSGLSRKGAKMSMDRPEMGFGIPALDDFSVIKAAKAIAPFHRGNYLVLEMKSNLVAADRTATLEKFPGFRKRSAVMMGEPSAEYKAMVHGLLLDAKKAKVAVERKKKAAEVERKRNVEKLQAAKKARLSEVKKEKEDEKAEEKEDEKAEEKVEDEKAPEEPEEPVVLTEAEMANVFRKSDAPDMAPTLVSKTFSNFSLPNQSEGFDAIDFLWQTESASASHLQAYISERKLSSVVETLKPGDWFKKEHKDFEASVASWKKRQNEWKNPSLKKALLEKIAAAKKAAKAETGEEGAPTEEADAEPMKIDAEDLDIFSVEDVMDIGSGEPLFANFAFEDWALLSLRFELHMLVHAFRKDIADPERTSFQEGHLNFYYNKYYHKQWSNKTYGKSSFKDVIELITENVTLSEAGMLVAVLGEEAQPKSFVHLVEEHRRDRLRRLEAGVESAELKFQKQPQPQTQTSNSSTAAASGQKKRTFAGSVKPIQKRTPDGVVKPTSFTKRSFQTQFTGQKRTLAPGAALGQGVTKRIVAPTGPKKLLAPGMKRPLPTGALRPRPPAHPPVNMKRTFAGPATRLQPQRFVQPIGVTRTFPGTVQQTRTFAPAAASNSSWGKGNALGKRPFQQQQVRPSWNAGGHQARPQQQPRHVPPPRAMRAQAQAPFKGKSGGKGYARW